MQFVINGPDIPNRLLEAHQEGKVVFFCGAGISYPAGLPDFEKLANQLFKQLGQQQSVQQKKAYKEKRFDTALYLLQNDLIAGRDTVRKALSGLLTPKTPTPQNTATHKALLTLAKTASGATRLVTTNFDRLFEHAIEAEKLTVQRHSAPLLPVVKEAWSSLVYLHGLLPEASVSVQDKESTLRSLILTSADFGLAYLSEGWAARFVTTLFKSYTVCFVGYSLNDPVLRYLTDALAIGDEEGEDRPEMFLFASYKEGQKESVRLDYESKNVTPILYKDINGHSFLHETLSEWAEQHELGRLGLENIVRQYAQNTPLNSTVEDNFVGRVLWALMEKSSAAARVFAMLEPAPPFKWFEVFTKNSYELGDLKRLGVYSSEQARGKSSVEPVKYSLLSRPAPYDRYIPIGILSATDLRLNSDELNETISQWLCRYLDTPELLLWVAQRTGRLSSSFKTTVANKLNYLLRIENSSNADEQALYKKYAAIPTGQADALPRIEMRQLWQHAIAGRLKCDISMAWYNWQKQFKQVGLTTDMRLQVRELLEPRVKIDRKWNWSEPSKNNPGSNDASQSIHEQISWEWVLAIDVYELLDTSESSLKNSDHWKAALTQLLADLERLLLDTLNFMQDIGDASAAHDRSHWKLPSVSPHHQNRSEHSWTFLIELLRDAWLAIQATDPVRAETIAIAWWAIPFPAFKRLALFAAAQGDGFDGAPWVEWLICDDGLWLHQGETKRERMRLFVLQANSLSPTQQAKLEIAVLKPIPKALFKADISDESYSGIVDRENWLHLSKLLEGGVMLSVIASSRLQELIENNPKWSLSKNQSDEFSTWFSSSSNPESIGDDAPGFKTKKAPRELNALISWLQQDVDSKRHHYDDDWREMVTAENANDHELAINALCALAKANEKWVSERWQTAFYAWADEKLAANTWTQMKGVFQYMPDDVLTKVASSVASWLNNVVKVSDESESELIELCKRIIHVASNDAGMTEADPVTCAINHPVGKATQLLIAVWFKRNPADKQGLSNDLKPIFTQLCDAELTQHHAGRVILAMNLIALYRVDTEWTTEYLLPLFSWQANVDQAKNAWEGFLMNRRVYPDLMKTLKLDFLATAKHYERLSSHGVQYISMLTYCALHHTQLFTKKQLREATSALPASAAHLIVFSLWQLIRSVENDKRSVYWKEYIQPFWDNIWPKTATRWKSATLTERLCKLVLDTEDAFPIALNAVIVWIQPIQHTYSEIHRLNGSNYCEKHPKASLDFLNAIVPTKAPIVSREDFESCLNKIKKAVPELSSAPSFRRLQAIVPAC